MSNKLTASEARQNFSDILNRAAFGRERVLVHRGKKAVAAIIPIEDYHFLEELEDRIDVEEARKRLNEPTIPWSKIKKELGLEFPASAHALCSRIHDVRLPRIPG